MANMYDLFNAMIGKINSSVKTISGKKPTDTGDIVVSYNDLSDIPGSFAPSDHNHETSDVNGLATVASTGNYNDLEDIPSPVFNIVFEHNSISSTDISQVTSGTQQTLATIDCDIPTTKTYLIIFGVAMLHANTADGVAAIRLVNSSGANLLGNRVTMPFMASPQSMGSIVTCAELVAGANQLTITAQTNAAAKYRGCHIRIVEVGTTV